MSATVIKHLPLPPRWVCGCQHYGPGIMPHYCPRHHSPPEIQFIGSGIANLNARQQPVGRVTPCAPSFAAGMVVGALIVWALVLTFTR